MRDSVQSNPKKRGRRPLNLEGQRFGKLTVVRRGSNSVSGHPRWFCECDCGGTKEVLTGSLRAGYVKSCGCSRRQNHQSQRPDLAGQTFGLLTVLRPAGDDRWGRARWLCLCKCTKQKVVSARNLLRRDGGANKRPTRSCGCLARKMASERTAERNRGRFGSKNPNWKDYRAKTQKGYVTISRPGHPNSNEKGRVLEHKYVMSLKLGRPIREGETIHHRNGIKDDNRPENLELWTGSHHPGQRVTDLLEFAEEIQSLYWSEIGFRPDPKFLRGAPQTPRRQTQLALVEPEENAA